MKEEIKGRGGFRRRIERRKKMIWKGREKKDKQQDGKTRMKKERGIGKKNRYDDTEKEGVGEKEKKWTWNQYQAQSKTR